MKHKTILRKKNKAGAITLPDAKMLQLQRPTRHVVSINTDTWPNETEETDQMCSIGLQLVEVLVVVTAVVIVVVIRNQKQGLKR